ncbi:unnamed protein product [Cylindrotheca closterium]|uniref:Methyltransferase domain-containing protein n=1 Tax=Cylindrotheca closterium TaxID=2856 RepID=A0AAD2PVR9_9STRA|nr:unnamed protein product [Cylindrotheca closterium]
MINDVQSWVIPKTRSSERRFHLRSTSKVNHNGEAPPVTCSSSSIDNNKNTAGAVVWWSDDEFQDWFYHELKEEAGPILHQTYGDELFVDLSHCVTKWRQRYRMGNNNDRNDADDDQQVSMESGDRRVDGGIWKRLFKRDRVVKEVLESIPIIHAIDKYVRSMPPPPSDEGGLNKNKITIVDLCSGKGYLSMILSEYLPPDKVEKFVLIDKAWPMCHAEPKPHHINWDHIYGSYTTAEDGTELKSYFSTWPIPLHTSKQNLKKTSDMRRLQQRLGQTSTGPCFVLGVHLCGTLSIQAVQMFYSVPSIHGLILKPCCLPGMAYEKQQTHFQAGKYAFPTKEVCSPGYWKKKEWEGPPRWHLQGKFDAWCRHLHEAMKYVSDSDVGVVTKLLEAPVQTNGGFQNTFLFAQKEPMTDLMWDEIERSELTLKQLQE